MKKKNGKLMRSLLAALSFCVLGTASVVPISYAENGAIPVGDAVSNYVSLKFSDAFTQSVTGSGASDSPYVYLIGLRNVVIGKDLTTPNITAEFAAKSTTASEGAVAIGQGAQALSWRSTAIGIGAQTGQTLAYGAVAVGDEVKALSSGSVAIGMRSVAGIEGGRYEVGSSTISSIEKQTAIGFESTAYGAYSIALGNQAKAGFTTVTDGAITYVAGQSAVAIGNAAVAYDTNATAIGHGAIAGNEDATAETDSPTGNPYQATAVGSNSQAVAMHATALGSQAGALADYSTAVGDSADVEGECASALGANAYAVSNYSTALGGSSQAGIVIYNLSTSDYTFGSESATAVGFYSKAYGTSSIAIGDSALAGWVEYHVGNYSQEIKGLVSGQNAIAIGSAVWAETKVDDDGNPKYVLQTQALGDYAVAVGTGAVASANNSIVIGYDDGVYGVSSGVIGDQSIVYGTGSYVLGNSSTVGQKVEKIVGVEGKGDNTFVIGNYVETSANNAFVLGGGESATTPLTEIANNSVVLGYLSESTVENTVSVGRTAFGNQGEDGYIEAITRRIMNVGDGELNTDAATYGQLADAQYNSVAGTYTPYEADANGIVTVKTNNGGTAFKIKMPTTASSQSGGGTTYTAGDHVSISADNQISVTADGTITSESTGLVTGKTVYGALQNNKLKSDTYTISKNSNTVDIKYNDASETTAFTLKVEGLGEGGGATYTAGDYVSISEENEISVTADGEVESGNEGLVTGGAVADAITEKTGDTSKLSDAGLSDNLTDSILDVNDRIGDADDRIGEVADGVTAVNNRVNSLSHDINKVGAGAAALAALHPQDFDPDDKWSFAVGYGHYRNANAGAFGAFYKPNRDTTFSVGSTIGNGDAMLNAGISFKLGAQGKGVNAYSSRAEMAHEMNSLRRDNEELRKDNAAQAKEIDALKAQIAQILAKLDM